jgi:hypothetical protein
MGIRARESGVVEFAPGWWLMVVSGKRSQLAADNMTFCLSVGYRMVGGEVALPTANPE